MLKIENLKIKVDIMSSSETINNCEFLLKSWSDCNKKNNQSDFSTTEPCKEKYIEYLKSCIDTSENVKKFRCSILATH